jgi:hypothetical protein
MIDGSGLNGRQSGAGLWGTLFVLAVLGFAALVTVKVLPLYLDHMKVVDAVADVAQRGGLNGQDDPPAIYAALQRHWDIDDIGGLKVHDVQLQRADSGGLSLGYSYDARAHLFYNVYLVLHFAADVPMRRSSGDR